MGAFDLPGSAEFLATKLVGYQGSCIHFPRVKASKDNIPHRLAFFSSTSSDISVLDTKNICLSCFHEVAPIGYNAWLDEGTMELINGNQDANVILGTSFFPAQPQKHIEELPRAPGSAHLSRLLIAGSEGYVKGHERSLRALSHLNTSSDDSTFFHVWQVLKSERRPFYIPALHPDASSNYLEAKRAVMDAMIAQRCGDMVTPTRMSQAQRTSRAESTGSSDRISDSIKTAKTSNQEFKTKKKTSTGEKKHTSHRLIAEITHLPSGSAQKQRKLASPPSSPGTAAIARRGDVSGQIVEPLKKRKDGSSAIRGLRTASGSKPTEPERPLIPRASSTPEVHPAGHNTELNNPPAQILSSAEAAQAESLTSGETRSPIESGIVLEPRRKPLVKPKPIRFASSPIVTFPDKRNRAGTDSLPRDSSAQAKTGISPTSKSSVIEGRALHGQGQLRGPSTGSQTGFENAIAAVATTFRTSNATAKKGTSSSELTGPSSRAVQIETTQVPSKSSPTSSSNSRTQAKEVPGSAARLVTIQKTAVKVVPTEHKVVKLSVSKQQKQEVTSKKSASFELGSAPKQNAKSSLLSLRKDKDISSNHSSSTKPRLAGPIGSTICYTSEDSDMDSPVSPPKQNRHSIDAQPTSATRRVKADGAGSGGRVSTSATHASMHSHIQHVTTGKSSPDSSRSQQKEDASARPVSNHHHHHKHEKVVNASEGPSLMSRLTSELHGSGNDAISSSTKLAPKKSDTSHNSAGSAKSKVVKTSKPSDSAKSKVVQTSKPANGTMSKVAEASKTIGKLAAGTAGGLLLASGAAALSQSGAAQEAWDATKEYGEDAADDVSGGLDTLEDWGDDAADDVSEAVHNAGSDLDDVRSDVDTEATQAWDGIEDIDGDAIDGVEDLGHTVGEGLEDMGDGMGDLGEGVVHLVSEAGAGALDGLEDIGDGVEDLGDHAGHFAEEVGDDVIEDASDVLIGARSDLEDFGHDVSEGAADALSDVESGANDIASDLHSAFDVDASDIPEDLEDEFENVGRNLDSDIDDARSDLGSELEDEGRDLRDDSVRKESSDDDLYHGDTYERDDQYPSENDEPDYSDNSHSDGGATDEIADEHSQDSDFNSESHGRQSDTDEADHEEAQEYHSDDNDPDERETSHSDVHQSDHSEAED